MQGKILYVLVGAIGVGIGIGVAFALPALQGAPEREASQAATANAALESDTTASSDEAPSEAGETLYDVVKVIDGDTITIALNGKNETVRFIGIDTPETSDPRTGVQCFGKEATAKLKSVIGARVSIEKDAGEGERDKYDRLLAYVYTEEGTMLNRYMIAQGYAYEYTYDDPYKYQKEFKAAEAQAKAAGRGLWAPDACPPSAPAKKETTSAPKAAPAPEPSPAPQAQIQQSSEEPQPEPQPKVEEKKETPPAQSNSSNYTCSSNTYNCSDFTTHAEAQAVYEMCGGAGNDIHKLDSNKDGEACESLP